MQTVAELTPFIREAERLLSAEERRDVIDHLAAYPKAGVLIEGTGGLRKLRWGKGDRGKSGGVRVVYYFYDENAPLYLVTIFAKNERDNLTKGQRNELSELTGLLASRLRRNQS